MMPFDFTTTSHIALKKAIKRRALLHVIKKTDIFLSKYIHKDLVLQRNHQL